MSDKPHEAKEEADTLRQLASGPVENAGKSHTIDLLDQFELDGPNGNHQCLITDALGPKLDSSLLTPEATWQMVKQLVEMIVHAHSRNIVHGGSSSRRLSYALTNIYGQISRRKRSSW